MQLSTITVYCSPVTYPAPRLPGHGNYGIRLLPKILVHAYNALINHIDRTLDTKLLTRLVNSNLALAFFWLITMVDANAQGRETVSTVSVGDSIRTAKDSIAILGKFAGKPSIDLYLFAQQLTPTQRQQFSIYGSRAHDDDPVSPIGHMMLFFREGAKDCDGELISYTAVFQRSEAFAIPILTGAPINWAYSGTNFKKYGVRDIDCRLAHGAPLKARIKHSRELNESNEQQFFRKKVLPANIDKLEFRWDLAVETTLIDRNIAFRNSETANSTLSLNTTQVADTDAIYISQYKAFTIRFYDAKVDPKNRGSRASADDSSLIGFVYMTTRDFGNGLTVTNCTISINEKIKDGMRYAYDARCDGGTNKLRLSGTPEVGTPIHLKMRGAAPADFRLKRPKMTWDFEIKSILVRVYRQ